MLRIIVDLLTDRYVAADVSDRQVPEWPPHPGRLYMSLAAACFERGADQAEASALRWLETLGAPRIVCGTPSRRTETTVYVPINDKLTPSTGLLQTTPGLSRSKQARSFPTTVPSSSTCSFEWTLDQASAAKPHLEALRAVCREVIRIGHSSSLVMAHAEFVDAASHVEKVEDDGDSQLQRWLPSDMLGGVSLRIATEGEFDRLLKTGMRDRIDRFHELRQTVEHGTAHAKKLAKQQFEEVFGQKYNKNLRPPEPAPATISTWMPYRCIDRDSDLDGNTHHDSISQTQFDPGLIVFSPIDGPRLGLPDALSLTQTLRKTVMKLCGVQPVPAWVSGHNQDGSATKDPHLAFLPLPYVGGKHGDGHLLGLALALPAGISASALRECLGPVIYDGVEPRTMKLKLGGLGHWELQLEQRPEPAKSLRGTAWSAPSQCWETVTPVVLDRFPKMARRSDVKSWRSEVADILRLSCQFAGLPTPEAVDVDTTAFLNGVPRATRKSKPTSPNQSRAYVGEGFRPYVSGSGKPARPQVHVRLRFDKPLAGPLLLGAGRFLGYGFFRPAQPIHSGGAR